MGNILSRVLCCFCLFLVGPETLLSTLVIAQERVGQTTTILEQNGITWVFVEPVIYGKFVSGDYYVMSEDNNIVCISGIFPVSKGKGKETRNGTMKNPIPGNQHGYDGRVSGYDDALNVARGLSVAFPLLLHAGDLLVSTVSRESDANKSVIDRAAILTVVSSIPPDGAFRPGYCDSEGFLYNEEQLDYKQLANLSPPATVPAISDVEDMFLRPWIDHKVGWSGRLLHPKFNMPDYGREIAAQIGLGALMLQLDFSQDEKRNLLVSYVQLGIDLFSVVTHGKGKRVWENDGGHASGRKWPILFAGIVLDDEKMRTVAMRSGDYLNKGSFGVPPKDYIHFGEDDQTFYVTIADVAITKSSIWYPDRRGGNVHPYDEIMIGMPEWGIRHSTQPEKSNSSWNAIYRQCCTAKSWSGFVLAAHIMGAESMWNHYALFDYLDRYMAISNGQPDPFGYSVYAEKAGWRTKGFVSDMWEMYRGHMDSRKPICELGR